MTIKTLACVVMLLVTATYAATILMAEEAAQPSTTGGSQQAAQKVMMIREASQPKGFPKPTSVGQIAVKNYPTYRAARVTNEASGQNSMFRILFQHIKKNSISMTAPVEMTYNDVGQTSMAFLYSNQDIGKVGQDGPVEVVDIPEMTVVSIGVRGNYSKSQFETNSERLGTWLTENSNRWRPAGEARYLAFNSPFVPSWMKYGEIQIPIRAVDQEIVK